MTSSQPPRSGAIAIIGLVLAAVPFIFGAIRYAETGTDARYVLTAFASTVGAGICARIFASHAEGVRLIAAFLAAALAAAAVSVFLLNVGAGPAVVIVSIAFGIFSAMGAVLLSPSVK